MGGVCLLRIGYSEVKITGEHRSVHLTRMAISTDMTNQHDAFRGECNHLFSSAYPRDNGGLNCWDI